MAYRQRIGRWGEAAAADFLERRGYQILDRNARTRQGEVDLVARCLATGTLVFVEVKTRTSTGMGLPETAVDARKLDHLAQAAEAYRLEHPELAGADWRFDVVAIVGRPGDKVADVDIEHFENISA